MATSLEDQERLRREFIANAAHELRTPLTNLQGYLEALRDGVISADRSTYESLWEEADRLVRLSRALDALADGDARGSSPELAELDLAAAIRSAADLAAPSFERAGLSLAVDVPDTLPARANPDHLAQVLANLLSNASRYSSTGGTVTIRAERRPADLLVTVANPSDAIPAEDVRPPVRAVLSGREVPRSRPWGRGHRVGHRQAARRVDGWPCRREIGRRSDPGLVQHPRLIPRGDGPGARR